MRRGFTIVEILVVMAILAVLAILGLGAFRSGFAQAKQVACANNLRQIGVALTTHAADNNGSLPETTHTAAVNQAWIALLEEDLGENYDEFRLCPADPRREERRERGGTSYVLNSYLFVPEIGPFGEPLGAALNNLSRIPDHSRTLMAFIVSDRQSVDATSDHTHSRNWGGNWQSLLADIQPDRHRSGSPSADHSRGSANYLFVDGHVESWEAVEVKRRIDRGENIATPPGLEPDEF